MKKNTKCTLQKYVCASERIKMIGAINGMFPDFGHHLEKEMGGLWMHPIKLLDGFWLRFCDRTAKTVNCWTAADSFTNYPWGNEFDYDYGLGHTTVGIKRFQYAPEEAAGVIVRYELYNSGSESHDLELEFLARTDLRPVWYSETIGIMDGDHDDIELLDSQIVHGKDCEHQWHVMLGCSEPTREILLGQQFGPEITAGKGASASLFFDIMLEPSEKKTITFYIAGSSVSQEDCLEQYKFLSSEKDFLSLKKARYEKIEKNTNLIIDDKHFQEVFNWVKVNTDWLVLNVPEYGRGIAAGLPEYPWWFGCDSFYTLQGILAMGDFQLCRDTLLLIYEYSVKANGNGRIIHEVTTNGAISNYGNTQETAHFITMIWKYYEWTGDFSLVEQIAPYMEKSVEWLIQQDEDGDLFPSGYGIIEIAGLNMEMIDSAVYTCEAYDCWSKICSLRGDTDQAERFAKLANNVQKAINDVLWSEKEGLYCDACTSYSVVESKLSAILEKTPPEQTEEVSEYMKKLLEEKKTLGPDAESGWLLNRNWVINTPMEVGIAPKEKAVRALEKMHTSEYIGDYGMYLNSMYRNATMTISTGVMAVAQASYGYADRALELIQRMFRSYSMATPGSISEMSPDYGCFVQAWTIYGTTLPVARYFFGIQPSASQNALIFAPCMPQKWTRASLENVKVLNGTVSVYYEKIQDRKIYTLKNCSGFPVMIFPNEGEKWEVNGNQVASGSPVNFEQQELTIEILFKKG